MKLFKSFLKWWKGEDKPNEYIYSPITKKDIVVPVGFIKNREEQDQDLINVFIPWADKNCKHCYGTANTGFDKHRNAYDICICVIKNLEKAKAQQILQGQRN